MMGKWRRKLEPIADRVARDLYQNATDRNRDVIRDTCDFATGGELDAFQLDLLCEMVERRLNGPDRYTLGVI